jgi:type I restriction enzyme S subunit
MTGTTGRQRVSADDLAGLSLLLPPLAEQRRIVDLIAAVDESIAHARLLEESAATSWFALANEMFTTAEVQARLDSIADVRMGRQRSPKNASGDFMAPYLRAANVKDGRLELDDILEMNFTPEEQAVFALEPGDVLVTEGCGSIGQLGASAQWRGEVPGVVCMQNTLLRLRAIPEVSDPAFLGHLARFAHHAGLWASVASGTNIFHIGSERAKVLAVPALSISEQRQMAGVLDDFEGLRVGAALELEGLRRARSALLASLLSGDHEIPESYDALLESAA